MNISFTPKQYRTLLKALFWAEWIKNAMATVPDKEGEELQELEQHLYSYTKQFQTTDWVSYDEKLKGYYPNRLMEDTLQSVIDEFEETSFWDELIHRMARKDTMRKYGKENFKDVFDLMEKEHPFLEKYEKEFQENGIKNLKVITEKENG
jgi:hypothetical protein